MTNRSWLNLASYYISFMSIGLTTASLGPTLPGLMAQTGADPSEISILFIVRPVGYLLGSIAAGRLFDRLPGKPIMLVAALIMAASMALIPVAPVFWLLLVVMFMVGVAESGIDVGGNTLIVWTYADKVAPYMSGLHFMFGVGAFIAPLVVAQAELWGGGIAGAYWALALLILPGALLLWRTPSPPVRARTENAESGRVNYLLVGLFAAFLFLYVGGEIGFGAWVVSYAIELGLADTVTAALFASAFWGALTVGRLISIPLASRLRPRTVLAIGLIGSTISLAIPLFFPQSSTLLWVGAIGAGAFMAPIFPTTITLAERRLTLTGQINSTFFIGASIGGMVVPWIIGQLFEPVGPSVAMIAIFSDFLLACVVFVVLMVYAPKPAAVK
jgi:MFS transporter, FHS family, Na+ dependent glucose transporter 1